MQPIARRHGLGHIILDNFVADTNLPVGFEPGVGGGVSSNSQPSQVAVKHQRRGCFRLLTPQAPGDGVAQESLIHRVLQGFAGVAVGEMAQASLARLIDPSGRRHRAIVRAVFEQQMDFVLVVGRRVLLVGDRRNCSLRG